MKKLILLICILALFSGCNKSPTSNSNAQQALQGQGEKLLIADVLARPDLPQSVIATLEYHQKGSSTTITEKYLEELFVKAKVKEIAKQKRLAREREQEAQKLLVEDVLKRPDLPKAAAAQLRQQQRRNPKISKRALESLIETTERFAARIPTKAKTEFKPREYKYDATTRPTGFDYIKARGEYYQIAVDHFKSKTIDKVTPEGKRRADKLIQQVISGTFFSSSQKDLDQWIAEANDLSTTEEGLREEPMFQMVQGKCLAERGEFNLGCETLEHAITDFIQDDYPARIVVYANWLFNSYRPATRNPRRIPHHSVRYLNAINYWLKNDFRAEEKFHGHVVHDLKMFFSFGFGRGELQTLEEFNKTFATNTDLPPWIRGVVRGMYFNSLAWSYRGSGHAHTVSDQGWEKFAEYQKRAASYLEPAHKMNPYFPEAATVMIDIGRTGNTDESEDYWFEEAIKADPNFYLAYENRLHGLTPQWGGSAQEMLDFAFKHSLSAGENSPVPYLALHCFFKIDRTELVSNEERDKLFADSEFKEQILGSLDKLVANKYGPIISGNIASKDYALTAKAVLATRFDEMEAAHDAFEKLRDDYVLSVARECGVGTVTFEAFRAPAFALTSEFQNEAQELVKLAGKTQEQRIRNSKKILELTDRVLSENSDPIGSLYFKKVAQMVRTEQAYQEGDEVKLTFDPALLNWQSNVVDQIKFETENSLLVDNRNSVGNFSMSSQLKLDGPKIIQFDLEFPDPSQENTKYPADLAPTVIIGTGTDQRNEIRIFGVGFQRLHSVAKHGSKEYDAGHIYLQTADHSKLGFYYTVDMPIKSSVKILVDKGHFEVYLNDNFITRVRTKQYSRPISHLSFTNLKARKGKAALKLSNIRVQKWKGAPPYKASPKKLLEYYEDVVKKDAKDKWNTFWLANAHHALGNFDDAKNYYEKAIELGLPKSRAAFFLGDLKEQQGDMTSALDYYRLASANENASCTFYIQLRDRTTYTTHENWASLRLAWYNAFSPDGDRNHNYYDYASAHVPEKLAWVDSARAAQWWANNGDFDKAVEFVNKALPDCPAEFEAELVKMKQSYQAREVYQPKQEKPLYLRLEHPIHFFRFLEDDLPAKWLLGWEYKG